MPDNAWFLGTDRNKEWSLFPGREQPALQKPIWGRKFSKLWPPSSHSFSRQGLPLDVWKSWGWAAGLIRWEARWIVDLCWCLLWELDQGTGWTCWQNESSLAVVGRLDLSQGIWFGDKTDYVGCIVCTSVMCSGLKAEGGFYKSADK